jgi:hypothetical protein
LGLHASVEYTAAIENRAKKFSETTIVIDDEDDRT